ncbi:MAG: ABC transporter substrate-binding protein [Rhizobiaceae bacterium]|nr:ABC transporter substrate-binding protein [Rhizobiaceae bacterium]MCV0407412.1 ABC transporter substrate-binding protein [Rhizobiaceae bacterium]
MTRRGFVAGAGATMAATLAMPAIVRAQTPVRVGYLHTLAVDGQIWLAEHMGEWKKQGLEMAYTQFTTGLELFQAMIGGSIDVLATGAVISNFPARGQGKAFLMNDVERATAQLWVNPAAGVSSFEELKGKQIATTTGTTAHVFLDRALRANGVTPGTDVELVNQRMSDAVTAFISGAVPAVALWVPFNISVRNNLPEAKMLVDAGEFYPEAAIMGGWATSEEFLSANRDALVKLVKAWAPANDYLLNSSDEALKILQENYYQQVPLSDLQEQYKAQEMFSAAEWAGKYEDGTVEGWLQQVTDFYVEAGGIENPVPASEYLVADIYKEAMG